MDKFANPENKDVRKRAEAARKRAEEKALLKEDFKKDPLGAFGFGLIAYRSSLGSLVFFFFIMSLLISPVVYEFEEGHAIDPE